jgi:hypothetical protein
MDSHIRALYKIDPQPDGPGQARQIIAEALSARVPARVVDDIKPTDGGCNICRNGPKYGSSGSVRDLRVPLHGRKAASTGGTSPLKPPSGD